MIHFSFKKILSMFLSVALTVAPISVSMSLALPGEQFEITGAVGLSDYYVVKPEDDSYYNMGFQTVLYSDGGIELDDLYPTFGSATDVYAATGAGGAGVRQTSGISKVDFSKGAVQYAADGKNYWVSFAKKQAAPKLFVNGLDDTDTVDLISYLIKSHNDRRSNQVGPAPVRVDIGSIAEQILDDLSVIVPVEELGTIFTPIIDAFGPYDNFTDIKNPLEEIFAEIIAAGYIEDRILIPKREIFLDDTVAYHDIFIANIGNKTLHVEATFFEGIYNSTISLSTGLFSMRTDLPCPTDFSELAGNKIRIAPAIPTGIGEISEVLRIDVYDEEFYDEFGENEILETFYIYLTGYTGDLKLTGGSIPPAVKYVPYAVQLLHNNKYEWNHITMEVTGGQLPDGMTLKPNGELYGVTTETGEFTFTVTMRNGDAFLDAKEYRLIVFDNDNDNVVGSNDYVIEEFIGSKTDLHPDDYILSSIQDGGSLFKTSGEYKNFMKKVWLNGKLLIRGTDYTDEAGSTKITIREQTLRDTGNNKTGKINTIAAEFREGGDENKELKVVAQNFILDLPDPPPVIPPTDPPTNPPETATTAATATTSTTAGTTPEQTAEPTQSAPEPTNPPAEPDTEPALEPSGSDNDGATEPATDYTSGTEYDTNAPATDEEEDEPPFELPDEPDRTETVDGDGDVTENDDGSKTVTVDVDGGDIEKGLDNLGDKKEDGETGALEIVVGAPDDEDPDEAVIILTVEVLKLMADAAAKGNLDSLIIKTPFANLTFSMDIIETVLENLYAQGEDALAIKIHRNPELTDAQKKAIGDNPAIGIKFMIGDSYVTELGGTLIVELPYTLKPGQKGAGVYVHHVSDGGSSERMPTRYSDGKAIFTTTHLSVFAVGYEEPKENPATGDSMGIVFGLMVFAVAGCMVVGVRIRKRGER